MRRCIAVLEDNEDRIEAMASCLADKFPFFDAQFFRSAPEMTAWLQSHGHQVICLSLDHDLEPPPHQPGIDPGSAREVVVSFRDWPPQFPVVLHTTNVPAAIAMEAELEERHWQVLRITPFGDLEWIATAWLPLVRQAILGGAELPALPVAPESSGST